MYARQVSAVGVRIRTFCWARAGMLAAATTKAKAIRAPLYRILHQRSRRWAIVEAFAAAGAFFRLNLVEVARLEEFRPDRRFGANLAAQPAGIANRVIDADLHRIPPIWCSR